MYDQICNKSTKNYTPNEPLSTTPESRHPPLYFERWLHQKHSHHVQPRKRQLKKKVPGISDISGVAHFISVGMNLIRGSPHHVRPF